MRSIAIFRFVMYRKPSFLFDCPPGAALLILVFAIYSFAWIFSVHPYYGGQSYQSGSPLLSVRAGWFALSTTPFIFAFAMKRNGVSYLTGVSHERLNVYHRCTSPLFHAAADLNRAGKDMSCHNHCTCRAFLRSGI